MTARSKRLFHYWLSIPGSLFFFLWILSGMVLVWDSIRGGLHAFPNEPVNGDLRKADIDLRQLTQLVPERVSKVALFYLGNNTYCQITTPKGVILVDAMKGKVLSPLNEDTARRMLEGYGGTGSVTVQKVESRSYEYKYGELPAWRGKFANGRIIHISAQSGTPQSWTDQTGMKVRAFYFYFHALQLTDSHTWNTVIACFAVLWSLGSLITGVFLYRRYKPAAVLPEKDSISRRMVDNTCNQTAPPF